MASRSRCRREIFSDSPPARPTARSGSVIIGDLSDGHLMCGRRAVDLAYRHLAEGAHQAALPFGWQRLPDRTGQPIAHRVIQASAPRRTALEYRVSAVRRFVSNYQRRLLWDIEEVFRALKSDGMRLEETQMHQAERLFKLAVVGLAAACRTIQLVDARNGSARPATDVIDAALLSVAEAIGPTLEGNRTSEKSPSATFSCLAGLDHCKTWWLELLL